MKYTLGIQTCLLPNSIALMGDKGEKKIVQEIKEKKNTVERLAEYTKSALKKHRLKMSDISIVSVCLGPGSFTGTRGGIAFAKGFCQFRRIPLVGVSAFDSLKTKIQGVKDFLIIMDAKSDRVYYLGGRYEKIRVDYLDSVLEKVDKSTVILGPGVKVYRDKILEKFGREARSLSDKLDNLTAIEVAAAGQMKFKKDPSIYSKEYLLKIKPLYILPPNITKAKDKNL